MALDSRLQIMPHGLNQVATTPPPSVPLSDSDPYPFSSDFDLVTFERDYANLLNPSPSLVFSPNAQLPLQVSSRNSSPDLANHLAPYDSFWSSLPSLPRPSETHEDGSTVAEPDVERREENELATESSIPAMLSNRRKRHPPTEGSSNANKRAKATTTSSRRRPSNEDEPAEDVGSLDVEDVAVSSMVQQQQDDEQRRGKEPTRLSGLHCVICLETPTDLTVTFCGMYLVIGPSISLVVCSLAYVTPGHLFCYACLMIAISGNDPSRSKCPVCRQPVNRTRKEGRIAPHDYQPLELKFTTRAQIVGREKAK